MRRLSSAAVVLAALGLAAAPARARTPEELDAEANALARDGKIAESLPLFREAARAAPTPARMCLVALTYFRLQRYPEAQLYLDRAGALAGERPEWCEGAVLPRDVRRALEGGAFAPVEIAVTPAGAALTVASLAPDEALIAPARVWLPWGTQRIQAAHPGYVARSVEVRVEGKEPIPLGIRLDPEPPPGAEPPPDEPVPPPPAPLRDRPRGTPAGRIWGWGLTAAGAVGLLAGGGFHLLAADSRAAAADLYAGTAYDAELARFESRRTAAIGLYAAGTALAGVGLYLLFTTDRPAEPPAAVIAPVVTPDTVGVSVSWEQ